MSLNLKLLNNANKFISQLVKFTQFFQKCSRSSSLVSWFKKFCANLGRFFNIFSQRLTIASSLHGLLTVL